MSIYFSIHSFFLFQVCTTINCWSKETPKLIDKYEEFEQLSVF